MGVNRTEFDRKIEATKQRREAEGRGKTTWERLKSTTKANLSKAKAKAGPALREAAKKYKESQHKGKGKHSMMDNLNRMSTYDPFGSSRSGTRKKKQHKKAAKKSPRRAAYKTVTYYR